MGASRVKVERLDESWKRRGKCRTSKIATDMFFTPDEDDDKRQERSLIHVVAPVCGECPVSGNCLDWAMKMNEQGIWGGTTTEERRTLKRFRERARCLRCHAGKGFIHQLEDAQVCMKCGLSWLTPQLQFQDA